MSHGPRVLPSALIFTFQLFRNLSLSTSPLPKTENQDLLLLFILRIICKGDYFSWFEFYFKILNGYMQGGFFFNVPKLIYLQVQQCVRITPFG